MKKALLAGLVALTGAASAFAQGVTSINAVGYANVTVPTGFSMIANPLSAANASLPALFPNAPANSVVYKFTGANFLQTLHLGGGTWTPVGGTNLTVLPGEGIFFYNPSAQFVNTFVGEVMTGNLVNALPAGFSIRSSQVPQAGALQSLLQFPAAVNDVIYVFNTGTGNYSQSLYLGANTWVGAGEPNIQVGQAFWVFKSASSSWNRTFSIN